MPGQILPKLNYKAAAGNVCRFLSSEFKKKGKNLAIVGVSGGVDSSLTVKLCEKAGLKVKKVFLPHSGVFSEPKDYSLKINIAPIIDAQVKEISKYVSLDKIDKGNIIARTRMIIQYALARRFNGLVTGTENLSEYYLGYFTLYGDQACDIGPIAGLWKTQVTELAEYLGLTVRTPSAELWPGQTDQKELGFTYQEADPILYLYCIKKINPVKIIKNFSQNSGLVKRVVARVESTKYKREGISIYGKI